MQIQFRLLVPMVCYLMLLPAACRKDVTIQPSSDFSGGLFIECILYPGETAKVYLSRSSPFFQEQVDPQEIFARGAVVTLSEEQDTELLQADSTFDKFRCRWVPYYSSRMIAAYGKTYTLKATYAGATYIATTTIDQPKVELDRVDYTPEFYDVYGGHDGVILYFRDAAGPGNYYRFQMDRMIDTSRHHAHILDVLKNDCTHGEPFPVTDLGRTIFRDENNDGREMKLYIEVAFEYQEGDSALIYLQSLDERSAAFYAGLDQQLQSILNPFIEPVFLKSGIEGTLGIFGSAVHSDPVLFIYPQDNP